MRSRLAAALILAAAIPISCATDDSPQTAVEPQGTQQTAQAPDDKGEQVAVTEQEPALAETQLERRANQPAESQTGEPSPTLALPLPPEDAVEAPALSIESATGYVRHLAEALGPRATGTEQEQAAAAYLSETFQRLGYTADIQGFTYAGRFSVSRIDFEDRDSVLAFRFPGSSEGAVSGVMVEVPGFGEPADFDASDVVGNIAVVNRGGIQFHAKAVNAESAGAIALVIVNRFDDEALGGTFGPATSTIPVLQISREAGADLRTRLPLNASIPGAAPTTGDSQNVIARKSDGVCRVVVGGHYDTVPEVSGANDNASGTALTLALAEAWTEHPAARDICFVAFGAEEQGLHGSAAFVRSLQQTGELAQVTAMLNLDAIGDGRSPYRIVASIELRALANAVAAALQTPAASGSLPMTVGSDHSSFDAVGVPVVFLFPPGATIHTPLDNYDNFNHQVFSDIAALNQGILSCLLLRAGSPVIPAASCSE
ncbi:MAG: M20/M25/M40 family metallo-hydrolase [Chloroflexi bacterium]|nr:M20/M25/M40 family metallo-hydrolase [Chloroflexota bacterium]MYI04841.1 M20/M25/M40 family metallo-hydrolase [Chloroflexota bacterium]